MSTMSLNDTAIHDKSFGDKIKSFCKDSDWRRFIYVLLIMFAILPAMADAFDVFVSHRDPEKIDMENYDSDEFCDDQQSCTYGFIACAMIVTAMLLSILTCCRSGSFDHPRVLRYILMFLLVIGDVVFVASIILTWINTNKHTACYRYVKTSLDKNKCKRCDFKYCKVQYFGEGVSEAVVVIA
eukprot:63121_1